MTLKQCQLIALDAVRELKIPLSASVLDDGKGVNIEGCEQVGTWGNPAAP